MTRDFFLKKANPLIVCGRPRAGTRFITNVLNSFPQVSIQGEIPDPVMGALEHFTERVDAYYQDCASRKGETGEKQYRLWTEKKPALFYALWAGASQSGRVPPAEQCLYFGYKRPGHEKYFEFYQRHFGPAKVRYVYCIRNFVDNYLSIKSRWPSRKVNIEADRYVESIELYKKALAAAPGTVLLFNLDDHKKHGIAYTQANVSAPLGLEPGKAHLAKLESMGAINRTEADLGRQRRTELNRKEAAYIDSRPDLASMFQELCA